MGFNPNLARVQLGKPMGVGRLEMEGCKEKRRGKRNCLTPGFKEVRMRTETASPGLARYGGGSHSSPSLTAACGFIMTFACSLAEGV